MIKVYDEKGYITEEISTKVWEIPTTIKITGEDIENIVITAIEGGIGYWAMLLNDKEEFKAYEGKNLCLSEKVVDLLINNKSVYFLDELDEEENKEYELTLDKLLNGIKLNYENRPWDNNLNCMDSITADCIFQYAMLGQIVYS